MYEIIKNIISVIFTKLFFRSARLIRLPVYIRNKSLFDYGNGFTTGYNCRIEMFDIHKSSKKTLLIGKNVKFGDNVHIAAGECVVIGNDCLFASKIYISDISHGNYNGINQSSPNTKPDERPLITKPVYIGDRVWIGENVSILAGVSIGEGSIIGANSVVINSIPSNSIAVGIPATVKKTYDFQNSKWVKV